MLKRTITGIFITLLVYAVVFLSEVPFVIEVATALLCIAAIFEIYRVTGIIKKRATLIISIIVATVITFLPIPHYEWILGAVFVTSICVFVGMMRRIESYCFQKTQQSVIVAFLVVLMFRAIPSLIRLDDGFYYLLFAVTVCFVTDVMAYLCGRFFGVHKMTPKISPKKTVEGALGGTVFTMLFTIGCALLLGRFKGLCFHYEMLVLWSLLASVIGQFGDLSMSVIKRVCGVKDYGKILPGHGGVLDRFDSHMFSVAFTLMFCVMTSGFIK